MTFDELYPDAELWFAPPHGEDDDGAVKCEHARPCWNCGTVTAYVDLDFEAHLCSENCRDVKWREYFLALRKGNDMHDHGETWKVEDCHDTLVDLACGCQDVHFDCGYIDYEHDHVECNGEPEVAGGEA